MHFTCTHFLQCIHTSMQQRGRQMFIFFYVRSQHTFNNSGRRHFKAIQFDAVKRQVQETGLD